MSFLTFRSFTNLFCISIALAMSGPAYAHHSFASFDMAKCRSLSGTVRNFELTYPHSWIWMYSTTNKREQEVWGFESLPPQMLRSKGVTKAILKPGEKITVIFNPFHDGRHAGSVNTLILPNGNKVHLGLGPECKPDAS